MSQTEPIKPSPKDCKGLMDWPRKMMIYKTALLVWERSKKTSKQ